MDLSMYARRRQDKTGQKKKKTRRRRQCIHWHSAGWQMDKWMDVERLNLQRQATGGEAEKKRGRREREMKRE